MPANPARLMSEARRRKVFRTAGIYLVGAAGVWGAAEVLVEALGLPAIFLTFVVVTSLAGLPFAVVLSWFYELHPERGDSAEEGPGGSTPTPPLSKTAAVGLTIAIVGSVGLAASVAMEEDQAPESPHVDEAFTRTQITFMGSARDPVFSPDGRYLAFRATLGDPRQDRFSDTLMVMEPGKPPRALQPLRTATDIPFSRVLWSGDGSEVWFVDLDTMAIVNGTAIDAAKYALYAVPVEGGERRKLWDAFGLGLSGPDGHRLVLPYPPLGDSSPGIQVRDLSTGEVRRIPIDERGRMPITFALAPATGRIAVALVNGTGQSVTLWTLTLDDDPRPRRLDSWEVDPDVRYLPRVAWGESGSAIYYNRNDRLWRMEVDPVTGAPRGEGTFTGHDLSGGFTVAPDGRSLVLEQRVGGNNLWVFPVEGDSLRPPGRRLTRGTFDRTGVLSPDGRRIAIITAEGGTRRTASVMDIDGSVERPLTSTSTFDIAWSPDGTRLVFIGGHGNGYRLFTVGSDGTGQRLFEETEVNPYGGVTWCAGGEIFVPAGDPSSLVGSPSLIGLDPAMGKTRVLSFDLAEGLEGKARIVFPVCSPDGKEVAFILSGVPETEAGLQAANLETGAVRKISAAVLAARRWSSDGWIYAGDERIPAEGGPWSTYELAPGVPLGEMDGQVGPDGEFVIISIPEAVSSDLYLIEYGDGGSGR